MAIIKRAELTMVDLKPKVERTDAIQAFQSQETPILRLIDSDGEVGTGYSLSLIHISEPTRHICLSRMPSSA